MNGERSSDRTALLVVDMLNAYGHEDADLLIHSVENVAHTKPPLG